MRSCRTLACYLLAAGNILAVNPAAEKSYSQALQLVSVGDSNGAESAFRKAWEMEPTEPRYIHDLAIHYIHLHQFPQALDVIRDSVKRSGPTALAWTLQGELLFEQKQYDAAYQSLRSALDISSDNYRAHELLGLIFSIHKRPGLGLEELQTAVKQNPNSAQVHFYCGRLYYQTGNYANARDELLQSLKLNPEYPQALENLGLAYEAMGDTEKAAAQYRRAIELQSAGRVSPSELAYVCLAVLVDKQGDHAQARSLLQQALDRNPNSAWANFELGRMLFQAGEDTDAAQHLKRSAELDRSFSRPHFFLAKLHRRNNRLQEARAEFAVFQQLDKDPFNRQPQMTR